MMYNKSKTMKEMSEKQKNKKATRKALKKKYGKNKTKTYSA